jgi:hypothetical protein
MDLLLLLTVLSILVAGTGAALVVAEDHRVGVGLLVAEYLGVAGLLTLAGQPGAALSRVAVGACAAAILVITLRRLDTEQVRTTPGPTPPGGWFRLSASLLVVAAAWGMSDSVATLLPGLAQAQAGAGVALLTLGLLHLGLTEDPIRWVFALLTAQLGFEVMYAVLEPSLAIQAILAGVHLGILLVGSDIAGRRKPSVGSESTEA